MGTSLSQRWKQWDMKKWAMLTESILKRKIKVFTLGSTDERKMIINAFPGVVTIYGSNDYKRSAPLGINHTIIRKDLPYKPCDNFDGAEKVKMCKNNRLCLELINPNEVLDIVINKFKDQIC